MPENPISSYDSMDKEALEVWSSVLTSENHIEIIIFKSASQLEDYFQQLKKYSINKAFPPNTVMTCLVLNWIPSAHSRVAQGSLAPILTLNDRCTDREANPIKGSHDWTEKATVSDSLVGWIDQSSRMHFKKSGRRFNETIPDRRQFYDATRASSEHAIEREWILQRANGRNVRVTVASSASSPPRKPTATERTTQVKTATVGGGLLERGEEGGG